MVKDRHDTATIDFEEWLAANPPKPLFTQNRRIRQETDNSPALQPAAPSPLGEVDEQ